MGVERTSYQAVIVSEEQLPAAIEHYRQAFDMTVSATSPIGAKLTGAGFTIILRVGEPAGVVLQEFKVTGYHDMEQRLWNLGCRPLEFDGQTRTDTGFFVKDPYGMTFQVFNG